MGSSDAPVDVQVRAALTGLDSANLDLWAAAHSGDVAGVEIDPSSVLVRGRHQYSSATATATRRPGQLIDALNEALQRMRTESGGP